MKKLELLFLLVLAITNIKGQQHIIDSLNQELETDIPDTSRVLILNQLANEYRIKSKLDNANSVIQQALDLSKEIKWSYGEALSYNNLSYINLYEQKHNESMQNALNALKIAETNNDLQNIGTAYLYIGFGNNTIGDDSAAFDYYFKSLEIRKKLNNKYDLGYVYTYLGNQFNYALKHDSALKYHQLALSERKELGDTRSIADSYLLIGQTYLNKRDYNTSLKYINLSTDLYEQLKDEIRLGEVYYNLGRANFLLKKYDDAEKDLFESIRLSSKVGDKTNVLRTYELIAQLFAQQGRYGEAYKQLRAHLDLKDSLNYLSIAVESSKKLAKFNADKEKKVRQLELKAERADQARKEALLKAENRKQFYVIVVVVILVALILVITLIIAKALKKAKEQKAIIEFQKLLVEEKNKEILDSINYAKRIQSAILPPDKLVKEYLQNSFILYKPKDIVAGDFYWIEHANNEILFAAADCTGHGVPGAMVSVVCHNALNRAVREHNLTSPGDILEKTREIVTNEFAKSEDDVRDGMDIALCSLSPFDAAQGSCKLQYAGAHNPLWIIRKGSTVIEEIIANKQPIGKFERTEPFQTHTIRLFEGDSIYLFSDGYADQFGGKKGKKFKSANFKELLVSISDKTMPEQRHLIDKAYEKWRGEMEQIDDVCVIGVRI